MVGSPPDSQQPPTAMTSLPHDRFCDELVTQTGLVREVVAGAGADLSATVPTAPDWTLADLLRHIGGNLRAVEQAVRTGVPVTEPEREVPGHAGPGGDDPAALDAWLAQTPRPRSGTSAGPPPPGPAAPPTTWSSTAPTPPARSAPPTGSTATWPWTRWTSSWTC